MSQEVGHIRWWESRLSPWPWWMNIDANPVQSWVCRHRWACHVASWAYDIDVEFCFQLCFDFAKEVARLLKVAKSVRSWGILAREFADSLSWKSLGRGVRIRATQTRLIYNTDHAWGMLHVVRSVEAHVRFQPCYCTSCAGRTQWISKRKASWTSWSFVSWGRKGLHGDLHLLLIV